MGWTRKWTDANPHERADVTSNAYYDWLILQPYLIFGAQAATKMKQHLGSD